MDTDGHGWTRMDTDGHGWTRMDTDGHGWTRMDTDERGWNGQLMMLLARMAFDIETITILRQTHCILRKRLRSSIPLCP
jgi:hypothetical protein